MQQAALPLPNAAPQAVKLPTLREELRLIPAASNADGSPAWMIQDPIINKFYRIGWLEFEILSHWHLGDADQVAQTISDNTTLYVDQEHVLEMIQFLIQHHLVQANEPRLIEGLNKQHQAKKQSPLMWLLHHYLFFRIPIIKPQRLLAALLPYVRWIFSPTTAWLVLGATLTGLFLAVRQWDTFAATFVDQLTWAGLFSYGAALVVSKCLHELGHALTATRYGVRVAHMGIAMLVMFPMPYTDTSESWKLTNPKQRLHIASAGIITELALAGFATLLWSLCPDGALRSALFFLATVSWLLTLAVNLSPFMRFDGYFILSDLIDFPNLHERGTAMAKTALRRHLLGFADDWPEVLSTKTRRMLVAFSSITWVYRITVFLGIAWLVYYFFFKVLGIILFLVEIAWFVVMPIWKELKVWLERRAEIKPNRIFGVSLIFLALIGLGLVPWQSTVSSAGWVHAAKQTVIYTPVAGKLVSYQAAGAVQQGQSLFVLTSPDIAIQANRSLALAAARGEEMRGLIGLEGGEAKRANLQQQQDKFYAEVKLHQDALEEMDLVAPFNGQLLDLDDNLSIGSWVHPKLALGTLIDPASWEVNAYVQEQDVTRLHKGDIATIYIQQSSLLKLYGKVVEIDTARINNLPSPMLDAQFGGTISTLPGDKNIPQDNLYKVRIALNAQPKLTRITTAQVDIKTQAQAWLPKALERIAAVFVRESGF